MSDSYNVENLLFLDALPQAPLSSMLYLVKGENDALGVFAKRKSPDIISTLYRKVRIAGPKEIYPSNGIFGAVVYTIKNFSELVDYDVSISAGTVSRTGNEITVTPPSVAGNIYLTVNRESSLIRVRQHGVVIPEVIYPSQETQTVLSPFEAILTPFNVTSGADTCSGVEVQVSENGTFTDAQTFSASGSVDRATVTLPVGSYCLRARYLSLVYGNSPWSEPMVFNVTNNTVGFQEQASIKKYGDTASSDFAGVVSASGAGEVILVCSPWSQSGKGAAYIYSMVSGSWLQTKEFKATVGNTSDGFGKSGKVSADGNTIVIGAPGTDANDGAVYVFTKTNGVWSEAVKIASPSPASVEAFGGSVSISSDGNTIVVGADYASGELSATGAAYVFTRADGVWTQKTKLCPSDLAHNDLFGHSVALSSNGTVIVVGAPYQANTQSFSGSAYIYELISGTWTLRTKITPEPEVESGMFGYRVAISEDGSVIAVTRLGVISSGGAVYFFQRSGNIWFQDQILQPTDTEASDTFGSSVDLSATGTKCVVGCTTRNNNQGKAYVLDKAADWTFGQTITEPFASINNKFSRATAISANAGFLIIGTQGHDQETGTVYIYE